MRWLVLFDVDGTLVTTGGKAFEACLAAYAAVVGRPASAEGFSPAGKTDPQIFAELLQRSGVEEAVIPHLLPRILDAYRALLPEKLLPEHVRPLPGACELLRALAGKGEPALGVLTGNVREGAQRKLTLAGLAEHLPVGAFGCDHPDRNQLLPFAVRRAEAHYATRFPYTRVVVVGDTERDVRCAHAWGAKAIAVAGKTRKASALVREKPWAVVPTLDPALFLPVLATATAEGS